MKSHDQYIKTKLEKGFSIYVIRNIINDKVYIGQTKNVRKRFLEHMSAPKRKHDTLIIKAVKNLGRENFYVEVLEVVTTREQALKREVYWSNCLNSLEPCGYNSAVGSPDNLITSDGYKQRVSRSNSGRKLTKEQKEKIRKAHTGKKKSTEHIANMSKATKGKKQPISAIAITSKKNTKRAILCSPSGEQVLIEGLTKFEKLNKFVKGKLSDLVHGKINNYRGWTLIKNLGRNINMV